MAKTYKAQRHKKRLTHINHLQHIAWGIVCLMLISVLFGITSYAQSLGRENSSLKQQLAAATKPAPTVTCKATTSWPAGTTQQQSVQTATGNRDFLIHLPADFVSNQYYPVLLFYPGKGATAQAAEFAYNLDQLPAIVVYPFPTPGSDGYNAWQSAPYSSKADDIGFTNAVLDKVEHDMCVDRTRVYAAGMSNGGGFASLLSCKLSNRIAAVAVGSGAFYMPDGDCKPPRPIPLINVHGDNDANVPYGGSLTRRLPDIDEWTATRAVENGCKQPVVTQLDFTTHVTTWDGCKNNATVKNVRIQGGDHAWGQVPNDYLWQFLIQYTL